MSIPSDDTEHIIETAFNEAFSAPSSRRQSMMTGVKAPAKEQAVDPNQPPAQSSSEAAATESASGPNAEEIWKEEYDEQVKVWRVQSAEAREKAESTRAEWEAIRAAEREVAAKRKAAGIPEPSPEVIPGPPTFPAQPSVQGKKEAVIDEKTVKESKPTEGPIKSASPATQAHRASSAASHSDTVDSSQKWEEVNSLTTSSPSMTFPEQPVTPPPQRHDDHRATHPRSDRTPPTATLSVFDTSLSTRTRFKALASSLAINLLLPFVNGVMLGFGEMFAKNVVLGWLGWGSAATAVGIRQRAGKASGSR